ncbi:molybdopterin-dependent oxidoreductase [Paraburkholderia susongensis]|uniref:Trimethylamine-N-oxide reductase (Cytochrome c) n=1 Tax=Paraburkholderia susongensis TaxID=1515439 RepID=A0A1X7J7K7_9BURK|nr:molybdopterin-dependent oxidoreductase [Paraburkholderia susongensis]SMG23618.1 trimethylamine-N-oxide reductase (cytochrome c) [Paraburkholderia susongensis]
MQRYLLLFILWFMPTALRIAARVFPSVREHLGSENRVIQLRLRDNSLARQIHFRSGNISARWGASAQPDAELVFMDAPTACRMLAPTTDHAFLIDALKNFKITQGGSDQALVWFGQLVNIMKTASWRRGTRMKDGTTRYVTLTNGGPVFVFVKEGKIIRTTPIDLAEEDAPSWTITARGRRFSPARRATVSPHALSLKSLVYSDKRILHPMKRVDFDPKGERNPQNRGISGYERISWDEALDIVAAEITRMKQQHGPGAIAMATGAHHQWGNINYYLSAMQRFGNLIGYTRVEMSPISWEGWYWGAMHHYGNSLRLGTPSFYGTTEDCLEHAEVIVFWSSDPESTNGVYAGFEGTERRLWAKQLGIEFVHIDPYLTQSAQLLGGKWLPIRPGTDSAFAIAIMHEWMVNETYDKDYVASRTTGFDEWRAYVLGEEDGIPKTPEWQEAETGIPAKDVRSLAQRWASKKTYLAAGGLGAGFGGACRTETGAQWARSVVMMMAMQGWGKPGINFGNLQIGAPQDLNFYFPGYAEGGISGDLNYTASAAHNYCRMPHIITINPVKQSVPRQRFAEAITEGKADGYLWDGFSTEGQFAHYSYPKPGHSPIHMLYRYGSSSFGTVPGSNRLIDAYRHPSLEFIVNQSIWMENEAQFADVILPACTALERDDISEWANCGGYIQHAQSQLNHRMMIMQHKCIEPLGESRSDYQIFLDILLRLGYGGMYSEGGGSELTWCERMFNSTDLPKQTTWKKFLKKGYHVVPPPADHDRQPVDMRWFAEGRPKDLPEANPLPGVYATKFGQSLPTQSGKFEFVPSSLRRIEKIDPARPAVNRYINGNSAKKQPFPLQLVTNHPVYSFHSQTDGKNSHISTINEHRLNVGGYRYWILRMSPHDAAARGLKSGDLVRVHNAQASVICALDVSHLVTEGVARGSESCAELDLIQTSVGLVDRGGCLNLLTPGRKMSATSDGIMPNSCWVEVDKWNATMEKAA